MVRTSISRSSIRNERGLSFALELAKHRTAVRFQDFGERLGMVSRDSRYGASEGRTPLVRRKELEEGSGLTFVHLANGEINLIFSGS